MTKRILVAVVIVLVAVIGLMSYFGLRDDPAARTPAVAAADPGALVARGRYLAQVGDCAACHTVRGGPGYAGGRAIQTPFGAIYSSNLTSDRETGIGGWTADDFWRALHNGKSKDGRLLYPAFPYPNYTSITREDADAMFAYFRTIPAVRQPNRTPDLRFPYNQRLLLVAWRALYFRPEVYAANDARGVDWNRGAYLVQGLGHCAACHTARNVLGATEARHDLGGALIPVLDWYAPSLTSERESGLGNWEVRHIVDLLKKGVSERGVASGPMAEVVYRSLQHLSDEDARAMAVYLKSLPQTAETEAGNPPASPASGDQDALKLGASLYEKHCAGCHKASGEGAPPDIPSLAGNRSVVQDPAVNPIRMVLLGGYPPSTQGNPRPYGMPPFGTSLNDQEVAALVSYMRNSWGNRASMISSAQVARYRSVPVD